MKRFDGFVLDSDNQCLWRGGERIVLAPKPFAVLRYLVDHPDRLIPHDELLDKLWPETYVQPQVLRTYMLELRKVLGDDARQPRFIQSLPKRGYRFVATVTEGDAQEAPRADPGVKKQAIVGRETELHLLQTFLQRTTTRQRQIVFVHGDSGIGKTALVDEFCAVADASGSVAVGRGQCVQGLMEKEEYYSVMEALAQLCASRHGDRVCKVLLRLAPAWLHALGHDFSSAPPPQAARAPGDLCVALEKLAETQPLLLVFEDLHWADASTVDLFSALARRRAPARLLLVGTCNPSQAAADHPLKRLKQDLLVHRLCDEIPVEPLTRNSIHELVCSRWGAMPAQLADFVHRHSEGNPLFALAIVEHLIVQGTLAQVSNNGAAGWDQRAPIEMMEAGVPDQLTQIVESEIQRLTPREQKLLEAGSLTSVAFPAWTVAAALSEDLAEIEETCDDIARRLNFVHRAGQDELPDGTRSGFYVFAHGIYREVLYRRQAAARRAQRHTRIAERFAQLFAGHESQVAREIAMHQEAAGNWIQAVTALRNAAREAQGRRSYGSAKELLVDALQISEKLTDTERSAIQPELHRELADLDDARNREDSVAANP